MQPQNMRVQSSYYPQANEYHSGSVVFSIFGFGERYFSSLMMRCPLLGGAFFLIDNQRNNYKRIWKRI